MIYAKFTQRYLATIVYCLILILGMSTLLLVYKFHLRRSPLLAENLRTLADFSKTLGKNISNSSSHGNVHKPIKDINKILKINLTETPVALSSNTLKNSAMQENKLNNDAAVRSFVRVNSIVGQFQVPNRAPGLPHSDVDNIAYTDTIYIDDNERGKINFSKEDERLGYTDISTKSSFDEFEVNDDLNYLQTSSEYGFENKVDGIHLGKSKLFSFLEESPETTVKPTKSAHIRAANQPETRESGKFSEESLFNLDAVYDGSQSFFENIYARENNDDIDDFSTDGSGSGDFGGTLKLGLYQPVYNDHYATKQKSTDWTEDHKWVSSSKRQQKNPENKRQQKNIYSLYSTENKKPRGKMYTQSAKAEDFAGKQIFHKNRLNPAQIKKNRNHESNALSLKTTKSKKKERRNKKSHIKGNNRQTILVQSQAKKIYTLDKFKLLQSTLKPSHYNNNEEVIINNDESLSHVREGNLSVIDPGTSSVTWLESRTRRIMGNVKKSEERSRQLLLCEEAGGGELCRMLFKGHSAI